MGGWPGLNRSSTHLKTTAGLDKPFGPTFSFLPQLGERTGATGSPVSSARTSIVGTTQTPDATIVSGRPGY